MLWICLKKQVQEMLIDILIEPIELVGLTLIESLQKNVGALLLNLQNSGIAQ